MRLEDKHLFVIYHTCARGIQKNIACLRPMSNSAFSFVGYGTQKRYIFLYSTHACVITYNVRVQHMMS